MPFVEWRKSTMPYFNEPLLSNWDPHMVFEIPKMQGQRIDPETIQHAVLHGGFAPFHKRHPRNFLERGRGTGETGSALAPKFLSQQARERNSRAEATENKILYGDESRRQFEVPLMYKRHEIKYSKFGIEDFDFR